MSLFPSFSSSSLPSPSSFSHYLIPPFLPLHIFFLPVHLPTSPLTCIPFLSVTCTPFPPAPYSLPLPSRLYRLIFLLILPLTSLGTLIPSLGLLFPFLPRSLSMICISFTPNQSPLPLLYPLCLIPPLIIATLIPCLGLLFLPPLPRPSCHFSYSWMLTWRAQVNNR